MNQWTKNPVSLWDRFHQKAMPVTESGCWIWIGATSRYGSIRVDGKMKLAHRIAWALYKSPAPDDLEVCHHCDVPLCVNPNHLFLGSHKENCTDRDRKGRNVSLSGERHANSKLTTEDVIAIRASDELQDVLAKRFCVNQATVSSVLLRKSWKHVP